MRITRGLGYLCLVFVLLSSPGMAQGQSLTNKGSSSSIKEGWYIIRPGDSLRSVTERYLGSQDRWKELWELNPEIVNPDQIVPGQRIRILLDGGLPANGALISQTSRRVEDRLLPLVDWQEAKHNDVLQPKDSLRTFDASSAELLFFDDTRLVLTENSLVIVGDDAKPSKKDVKRTEIEIVLGQADLTGRLPVSGSEQIEIVLGDATMKPMPDAGGKVETRARKADKAAQLMVYTGAGELSGGGGKVNVAEGMGSSVAEGKPPTPPEKLLPAPSGLNPPAGAQLHTAQPVFQWAAVEGAQSYSVEVCLDPPCSQLVVRQVGLEDATWQPEKLPVSDLFWRVTATSASGLDGYPSKPLAIAVLSDVDDSEPPVVEVKVMGRQTKLVDRLIVGPGFSIEVTAKDEGSGVERWWPVIDGKEASQEALAGPWVAGEHPLSVVVVDRVGNRTESDTLRLIYDDQPPTLSWGLEGGGKLGTDLVERFVDDAGSPPPRQGRQTVKVGGRTWFTDSDFTQVLLRPQYKAKINGAPESLRNNKALWVLAEDDNCPLLDHLSYDLVRDPAYGRKGLGLKVETVDCVGNRVQIHWPLSGSR